ncbi:asparagine synthetase B [Cytobacillus suaedae]|nr:asparagine synthetase B [Cytobacillus suaedae]
MSAIFGSINWNNEPVSQVHIDEIINSLSKFPADDMRAILLNNKFFGCLHQWITPESIGEVIPYFNSERDLAIVSDAIIDNREELFNRLHIKSERQKEITDSQLILEAYQYWGESTPEYLVGDFAFFIWDGARQKLFGARDFSGSRTMYYFSNENNFSFCTVIKPLFSLPFIKKQLNEVWLAEYLAIPWNFESVDTSSTVYKNIHQLPPSHSITVVGGDVKLKRYCHLDYKHKLKLRSNSEYEEAFLDVYKEAVKSRLRTHRNVGGHLSGGLDSGSVASIAARSLKEEGKKLQTFSYVPVDGFNSWTPKSRIANERALIKSTVEFTGNIEDNYYSFPESNPFSVIDDWIETLEMPYKFFENSFWLSGIYEKAFEKDVAVLLNGQRGNWTVSWGPAIDYQVQLFKKFQWLKMLRELCLYSRNIGTGRSRLVPGIKTKILSSVSMFNSDRNDIKNSVFPIMINPEFARELNVYEKLREQKVDLTGHSITDAYAVRKIQFQNLYYWNINGTYSTKLSLRYKVWDRDPTNDLRVVKFCLSVPEGQYVQNGLDRALIRRATKGLLPDNIRLNQKTRGIQGTDGIYRMLPEWNQFIDELEKITNDPQASYYLNVPVLKEFIVKFVNGAKQEDVFELDFKMLMKSLIVYRFLKTF